MGRGFSAEPWPEATVSTEREDRKAAARDDKAQPKTGDESTSMKAANDSARTTTQSADVVAGAVHGAP